MKRTYDDSRDRRRDRDRERDRDTYYRDPSTVMPGSSSSNSNSINSHPHHSRHSPRADYRSPSRDRDRDRDRDYRPRDRSWDRDRERERERERERDRYGADRLSPRGGGRDGGHRMTPSSRYDDRDYRRDTRDDGLRRDRRAVSPRQPASTSSVRGDPSRSSAVPLKSSSSSAPSRTVGEKGVEEDAQEEVDYDALYESKSSTLRPKSVKEILAEKEAKRLALLEKLSDTKQRLRSVSGTPGPPSTLAPASTESSLPGTPATNQISKAVGKLKVEGTASPALNPPAVLEEPSKQLNAEDDSDEDEEGAINESDFIDLRQSERVVHEPVKHLAPEDGQSRLSSNGHPGKDSGAGPRTTDLDAMEVSAADYNPDEDRMLDDRRERERFRLNDSKTSIEPPQQHPERPVEKVVHVTDKRSSFADSRIQEGEEEDDDDDDDMFVVKKKKPRLEDNNVTSQEMQEAAKMAFVPVIDRSATMGATEAQGSTLIVDNFDDPEGYYRVILGELLDTSRYHVIANLGKGMFSNVVRARDLGENSTGVVKEEDAHKYREVAIKIVRSQESMYRAGQKEAAILKKLRDADPTDKKHIVRLERTFEHRGHLCLVFESLSMNLRDVVKRFGKDVGINLRAVRAYAHQIFLALNLMRKSNIMHADIKPDNILVNESKSVLKVCDLGSASDTSEAEITPYLVSRFYRAPEIILGLPYDCSLDMWSIGCTLYELYTGRILFPGRSNNHMLLLVQELKGKYPSRLIKKSRFGDIHFDDNGNTFVAVEKNKITGAESIKKITIPSKPASDLKSRLMAPATIKKLQDDELKLLTNFVNLLDRALELDPAKRLTPKEALNHPFLR